MAILDIFGSDVSTFPDLDPTFTPTIGPRVVAEAILRRLSTPAGTLEEDPEYGEDILGMLNGEVDSSGIERKRRRVVDEILKDERIEEASVELIAGPTGDLRLRVAFLTAGGPFSMVVGLAGLTLAILTGPEP